MVNGARLRKLLLGICLGSTQKRWRAARRERSEEAELVADMKFSQKRSNPERIWAGWVGSEEVVRIGRVEKGGMTEHFLSSQHDHYSDSEDISILRNILFSLTGAS